MNFQEFETKWNLLSKYIHHFTGITKFITQTESVPKNVSFGNTSKMYWVLREEVKMKKCVCDLITSIY